MISRAGQLLRGALNARMNRLGYPLRWIPPRAVSASLVLDVDFACLAAHLMLSVPKPFFIGIGANDGVTHDPLYSFIRDYGWPGVMVEPIPEVFTILERNYASFGQVKLVQAAIGTTDGTGTIYSVRANDPTSTRMTLHSSFDRNVLLKATEWYATLEENIVEVPVPIMRLDTLLEKTGADRVDVLKIDTEGHDLEILQTVDLKRLAPRLILAEYAHLSRDSVLKMADILLDSGYSISMNRLDMLAYRRDRSLL